jgi:hypothetical protein
MDLHNFGLSAMGGYPHQEVGEQVNLTPEMMTNIILMHYFQ